MPKRVVDADAIATSSKLRYRVNELYRLVYPYLIGLATANGTFECDPEMIHSKYFAFLMPIISLHDVRMALEEFARAGLLFRWRTRGKVWGFWVGIDKPGRLPSRDRIRGRHEKCAIDEVPTQLLESYIDTVEHQWSASGAPVVALGFGFGSGSGSGLGIGFGETSPPEFNEEDGIAVVDVATGGNGSRRLPPQLHQAWSYIGSTTPIGHVQFQGEWEAWWTFHYPQFGMKTPVEAMEAFIQEYQQRGKRIPPQFFELKHRLAGSPKGETKGERIRRKNLEGYQERERRRRERETD